VKELARYGPFFVAMWGWASLALAVAHTPLVVAVAVAGLLAALVQQRRFVESLVAEGAALLVLIWFAPFEQIGFVAVGAALVVGGRALAVVLRRYRGEGN
jgi:hypothetical protein